MNSTLKDKESFKTNLLSKEAKDVLSDANNKSEYIRQAIEEKVSRDILINKINSLENKINEIYEIIINNNITVKSSSNSIQDINNESTSDNVNKVENEKINEAKDLLLKGFVSY